FPCGFQISMGTLIYLKAFRHQTVRACELRESPRMYFHRLQGPLGDRTLPEQRFWAWSPSGLNLRQSAKSADNPIGGLPLLPLARRVTTNGLKMGLECQRKPPNVFEYYATDPPPLLCRQ